MSARFLTAMAILGCAASVRQASGPALQLHENVSTEANKFFDQGGACCTCELVVIKGGWFSKDKYGKECKDELSPTKGCGPHCLSPVTGFKCINRAGPVVVGRNYYNC
ncbi:unnamed protein product [Symbiodinium sp. CCMP2456]|nr:unnamed protein product [Symbiodinium sp. CCMP2456]